VPDAAEKQQPEETEEQEAAEGALAPDTDQHAGADPAQAGGQERQPDGAVGSPAPDPATASIEPQREEALPDPAAEDLAGDAAQITGQAAPSQGIVGAGAPTYSGGSPAAGASPFGKASGDRSADEPGGTENNLQRMLDVPLDMTVELGRCEMQLSEVLNLQAGSVVEINRLPGEPIDLLVNGSLFAKGEVVVINDTLGYRIIELVAQARASREAGSPIREGFEGQAEGE
jgi:flagellar motor switch protein FliN/FliY